MNQNEYVRLSLELHLFFDRIMKEHSLFLEASFTEKDQEEKKIASNFRNAFSNVLESVIPLANGNVSREFIESFEMVTLNTMEAENKTSNLLGIPINTNITTNESRLRGGNPNIDMNTINSISHINKKTLPLIEQLIHFKQEILNKVLSCKMYTTNYPLLISHIMNEAKMYHQLLSRVEEKRAFTKEYIYEQEVFWDNIMKEHAEFIRGLLDPTEERLILTADKFNEEYKMILNKYSNNPNYLTKASLTETLNFRDFKVAGEEGILNCKIKSIIVPLLSDHVVREANHFIRILNGYI